MARRWRAYETAAGRRPVRDFIDALSDEDAAEVVAAMAHIRREGLAEARKLRGDIWEVRADGEHVTHRVLFAVEGDRGLVLLALAAFTKKSRTTPPALIELAEARLNDWRSRARYL